VVVACFQRSISHEWNSIEEALISTSHLSGTMRLAAVRRGRHGFPGGRGDALRGAGARQMADASGLTFVHLWSRGERAGAGWLTSLGES